jgi:antitoxin component of MazEF toxin-antitoxin module
MTTVKIFKAGNSEVVAIPRLILQEVGLGEGQRVVLEPLAEESAVIIRPLRKKKQIPLKGEFRRWLSGFLQEDAALLRELAER